MGIEFQKRRESRGAMRSRACLGLAAVVMAAAVFSARGEGRKLKVLATFLPVYCFAANVAGDLADVDHLLPPGSEPHDFQFTPREMRKVEAADVIVLNGLEIESWLDGVIGSVGGSKEIVRASDGLKEELITSAPYLALGGSGDATEVTAPNPHVWLDPALASREVMNILTALQKADPANAEGYARNAQEYRTRLAKLDADLATGLAPLKGRPIVTSHDAFPYFARRYGLRIVGVIERQAEVTPSLRYLGELGKVIQKEQVRVIFAEVESAPQLADRIGQEYGVAVAKLDTLETGEFTPAAYEDGMRKNLAVLEEALK
jgi:zinc transport system substrate-binding protein